MSPSGDPLAVPDPQEVRPSAWPTTEGPPWPGTLSRSAPLLRTLSPSFKSSKHQVYLDALQDAVEYPLNQSIALSGNYGSGKSSVLSEFTRLNDAATVEISFSGLRADLPRVRTSGTGSNPAAGTKTNQIQKEIVKQLLYRERPAAMPGSRYRRPETFQRGRESAIAGLFGFVLTAAAFLAGFLDRPVALFGGGAIAFCIVFPIIAVFAAAAVLGLRRLFHNRVIIEKLSAGSASIALSSQASSYFDEYIDEIVYFFQVSKRRFVIFEDLDRFDDYEIFQSLGALNVLLNRSAQIGAKPIVFIYAVRDSIFEDKKSLQVDTAKAELERANRTKFFDLVIPMVPFVSNRNARDLMLEEAAARQLAIAPELIDLAAQHVADMRLIRNILNEFALFHKVLIENKTGVPGLTSEQLFSIILYKNVHLADFEDIGQGKSNLDAVYEVFRTFIDTASTAAIANLANLGIQAVSESTRVRRARAFGVALRDYLRLTSTAMGLPVANHVTLNGVVVDDSQLELVDTWKTVSEEKAGLEVLLAYNVISQPLTLSFETLGEIVGGTLAAGEWRDVDVAIVSAALETAKSETRALAYLTMADLHKRLDLTIPHEDGKPQTFEQAVAPIVRSDLARALLKSGYIDEYFALYAAQYHSHRVSINAMNFILRRVDRGLSDPLFKLPDPDAESVLRERPEMIRTQSVCNIALFDHILVGKYDLSAAADQAVNHEDFLNLYFTLGSARDQLVVHLTKHWPGTLAFLSELDTDAETRLGFMKLATDNLREDLDYTPSPALTEYIVDNAERLPFLTGDASSRAALKLMKNVAPQFADLGVLGTVARAYAIENDMYVFDEENFSQAIGRREISLDNLQAVRATFRRATANLEQYFKLQLLSRSTPFAIKQGATLELALNTVTKPSDVEGLLSRSLPAVRIVLLSAVPKESWPALARTKRFPPSALNLHLYVTEHGFDAHLEALVRSRRNVEEVAVVSETDRVALIVAILAASSIAPVTRSRISRTLLLGKKLSVTRVPPIEGELFGQLLKAGVLIDDEASFVATKGLNWATREAFIANSKTFRGYVTPAHFTPAEVTDFIASKVIPASVRMVIFSDFAGYVDAPRAGVYAVALFAHQQNRVLTATEIISLAKRRLSPTWVIILLGVGLAKRPIDTVEAVLNVVGKKYAQLTTHSRSRPNFADDIWHQRVVDYLIPHGKVKRRTVSHWDPKVMVVHMH